MRVLIDTTFASRGPSGTAVYVEQLIAALRGIDVEVVEAANPRRGAPGGGTARSLAHLAQDRAWEAVGLPRAAREAGADVLHHPLPAHARSPLPQVVTVHDLAFERVPECFDRRYRAWASRAHRSAARRAGAVVAVSETTALDMRALWGVPETKIVVAPHGPGQARCGNERLDPSGETAQNGASDAKSGNERLDPLHFLYVGDDEPRKDLGTLREAHKRADTGLPLVIAGSAGTPTTPQELDALYAGAAALVHPALYEGFGLTPLEAMAAGTPVIAARAPGITETCGDAALYVPPRDPDALAAALRRIAAEPALREDLSERGRVRARAFDWGMCAQAHLGAYTLAAG